MGVGLRSVRWDVNDFLQIALQSPLSLMVLRPCLIYFFDYLNFGGRGAYRGRRWYRWVGSW